MYGFPADLDLTAAVGQFITQICVGPFDLQFTIGHVAFAIQSAIELTQAGQTVGAWKPGLWPAPAFYEILNNVVTCVERTSTQRVVLTFENNMKMHLSDDSEQYEAMQIYVGGESGTTYII